MHIYVTQSPTLIMVNHKEAIKTYKCLLFGIQTLDPTLPSRSTSMFGKWLLYSLQITCGLDDSDVTKARIPMKTSFSFFIFICHFKDNTGVHILQLVRGLLSSWANSQLKILVTMYSHKHKTNETFNPATHHSKHCVLTNGLTCVTQKSKDQVWVSHNLGPKSAIMG